MIKKWIAMAVALAMMAVSAVGFAEDTGAASDKAAIEAALNPAESKYYYFFTDNDWNYYYNETLSGHQSQWNQLIAEGKAGGTATTTAKQ